MTIKWVVDAAGCWIWQQSTRGGGYGQSWDGVRPVLAHRLVYEQMVGPIPKGLELDHLCRVKLCVNPAHLEPVTHAENMRRAALHGWRNPNREKVQCRNGHPFSDENTYVDRDNSRHCRTCDRLRHAAAKVA